jgi:hypothetical protein
LTNIKEVVASEKYQIISHNMSYETIQHTATADEISQHEKDFGKYNDAPPGFTEITAEEFTQSGFFTWCLEKTETRQVLKDRVDRNKMLSEVPGYLPVTLFYMNHGDHYALSRDYWAKKVRYFKFAKCYHDYQEVSGHSVGNCYHVCKCVKCGDVWEYDSSG